MEVAERGADPAGRAAARRDGGRARSAPTSSGSPTCPGRTTTDDTPRGRARARRSSNEDHYDIEKVKERILEFLAVRKLKRDLRGPDPLLRRPARHRARPRSAARSRARMGRKFARLSLGGVRDEAEIRGHRAHLRRRAARPHPAEPAAAPAPTTRCSCSTRSTSSAPTSAAIPSSALLEVLDPEQNYAVQRPLPRRAVRPVEGAASSRPRTCSSTIPPALRDRMEVIELPGYTEE